MKKLLIILIALLPLATFAGNGDDKKDQKIDIHISTGKDGKIVVTGLKGKDLEKLQKNINEALKDIDITISDGKEKHTIHFKAELNID